jgi:serine/threonine protein kinase
MTEVAVQDDGCGGWAVASDDDSMVLVRQLASGSHSRCFLIRHDGVLLVHKQIPVSHMTAADQEVAEREVNILATFSHPFIVRYKRAFVRQGQLCIVMEHAEGGDLTQHMEQLIAAGQRPGLTQVLDWFVQLLFALKYIHGYKVRSPAHHQPACLADHPALHRASWCITLPATPPPLNGRRCCTGTSP